MYGKNEFNPFLILAVICTAFAVVTEVHQIPDKVDVLARQNASLQCSFELFKNKNNIRVYWWKTGERQFFREGDDPRKMFKVESRASAALKIRNVTMGDAGIYYCRVEGEYTGNGTGVTLGVKATPEPMKILKSQDADGSLLCKTSGFYPADYSLSWYRDGQRITNGVKTNHQLNAESLTEASSYLHDTQPAQEGTIYKCEVSHSTLKAPASATYIVKPAEVSPITSFPWWIPLCGALLLLLLIIVAIVSYKLCKARKGKVQMKTCVRCTQPIVANPSYLNDETVQGNTQMEQWNPITTAEVTDATPKVKKHRKRKNDPMNI